jgi:hypothetical protein
MITDHVPAVRLALLHCAISAQPRSMSRCAGSDHQCELVEDGAQLVAARSISGDVVVAAAQVSRPGFVGGYDALASGMIIV